MNAPGVLLDTGPLVALLSKDDAHHERARRLFAGCAPPFRCCESVVAEACFLMRKIHATGPVEVIHLARRGLFQIALSAGDRWTDIEALLKKYANRRISLADASLITCAELHDEPRIATFDEDFTIYRWRKNRKFEILQ